jgi:hypothetical protein
MPWCLPYVGNSLASHTGRKPAAVWANPADVAIVTYMHQWYPRIEYSCLALACQGGRHWSLGAYVEERGEWVGRGIYGRRYPFSLAACAA